MQCDAFDQGRCRSCTLLDVPVAVQLAAKQRRLEALLAEAIGAAAEGIAWEEPLASAPAGFRAKAKMAVGGTLAEPTLGILDGHGLGVDLTDCQLHERSLQEAFPAIRDFVIAAAIPPYLVPERSGELKHVIVTANPSGQLMVRLVLRSTEAIARIRKHLPGLLARLPQAVVVTANIQPEHKAVLEGEREIPLTEQESLPMPLGAVTLQLRPQSFLQTNTDVATRLYALVADWVRDANPASVWDLYCGVGGFAMHALAPGRAVTGVEVSQEAVRSANAAAAAMADAGVPGSADAAFVAADATTWASAQPSPPELVIVNPPRRGIGPELAAWLEDSGVERVVYSSCNAATLARDLIRMPSLTPVQGRLLDMFPHTEHFEAVLLLERRARA